VKTDGALALLALLSLFAFPVLAKDGAPPAPRAKIVIATPEHVFGNVEAGAPLEHRFELKNEGTADLQILKVKPACGCTTSNFDSLIAPGKTGGITLAVKHTASYKGEVTKTATVTTNDPDQPTIKLTLRATFPSGEANKTPG
jgi:hypothetical protein